MIASKIIEGNFFSTLGNVIGLYHELRRSKTDYKQFKNYKKEEQLILETFTISEGLKQRIDNYYKLLYVVEIFLLYELDRKQLKIYVTFTTLAHNKVLSQLLSQEENMKRVIEKMKNGYFIYFNLLYKFLEIVKLNGSFLNRTQSLMNKYDIYSFIRKTVSEYQFKNIGGRIILEVSNSYFNNANRFVEFANFLAILINNNSSMCDIIINEITDTAIKKKIISFIFYAQFQKLTKQACFTLLIVFNILLNHCTQKCQKQEQTLYDFLVKAIEKVDFKSNLQFFKFILLLIENGHKKLFEKINKVFQLNELVFENFFLKNSKALQIHYLIVLEYLIRQDQLTIKQEKVRLFLKQTNQYLKKKRATMFVQKLVKIVKLLIDGSFKDLEGCVQLPNKQV